MRGIGRNGRILALRSAGSVPHRFPALLAAFALLGLPTSAAADGTLKQPRKTSSLGAFNGVSYEQYDGFFVGRTSTGSYRVPYRISAPADPRRANRAVLVEPPHFAEGAGLRDLWLGRSFLFARRFVHASVGYSTASFGEPHFAFRILDPEAKGVFINGGVARPDEDGVTDDEIVVDFAHAVGRDKVALDLAGRVERRYIAGFSDSADHVKRILASGLAEGLFELAVVVTTGSEDDPQESVGAGRYSGKAITVDSEFEWYYGSALEDRGESPDHYRFYITAGTPHVADTLCPRFFANESTPASWEPALRAHFLQGHTWVTAGVAPPASTRLATTTTDGATDIARDANGNALLLDSTGEPAPRLPFVELGEATFETGFLGGYSPQPPPTIAELGFASHADYLTAFTEALEAHVEAGYMLDEDAQALLDRAQLAPPATFTENYLARYDLFRAGQDCR